MTLNAPRLSPAPDPVPQLLRDLIHDKTGIYFDSERLNLMMEKLGSRVLAHRCATYLDYYYILKYEEKGADEWLRVMDVFSVPETYFWREADQLRVLITVVVPRWFARSPSTPLRIWSAACATGEEPYSIVMALQEAGWGAHPAIAARVKFRRANLLSEAEIRPLADAEVIFCRNVFIYFSPASTARVVASFARGAAAGSHLFVGASESLLKLSEDYELCEMGSAFVYRRKEHA